MLGNCFNHLNMLCQSLNGVITQTVCSENIFWVMSLLFWIVQNP